MMWESADKKAAKTGINGLSFHYEHSCRLSSKQQMLRWGLAYTVFLRHHQAWKERRSRFGSR